MPGILSEGFQILSRASGMMHGRSSPVIETPESLVKNIIAVQINKSLASGKSVDMTIIDIKKSLEHVKGSMSGDEFSGILKSVIADYKKTPTEKSDVLEILDFFNRL